MAVAPYAGCPCGSGKQFKWCCQPYYSYVEKARHQIEHKQPAAAEQSMAQLVEKFPKVAQAWGYQAQFFVVNGKNDQAEGALEKAFEIDSNFAYGYFLRASMRLDEGELVGALILFRTAAELLDPNATQFQAMAQTRIAELELQFNHPVAARVAMDLALHVAPATDELRQAFTSIFGSESRLPEIARKAYEFRPVASGIGDSLKPALALAATGKLRAALKATEHLAETESGDPAVHFNLGLVHAWLGDNRHAMDALRRSIDLDTNESTLEESGSLSEVLRLGTGMEDDADYLEHRAFMQILEAEPVNKIVDEWGNAGRLLVVNANKEEGAFSAMILEETQDFGVGLPLAKIQSYLVVEGDILRFWHSNRAMLDRTIDEFRSTAMRGASEPQFEVGPAHYGDVVAEIMLFPTREGVDPDRVNATIRDRARTFFEETWLRRPLKSLRGASPVDAAAHPDTRKRLFGVVKFMAQCLGEDRPDSNGEAGKGGKALYDFNRLRRKLGLIAGATEGADIDFDTMSATDLGSVQLEGLADDQIAQAFRAALRLDVPDLAAKSAWSAIERATISDRYRFFNHLMQAARDEGNFDEVLRLVAAAEQADTATNGGARLDDLALIRGRTLALKGDVSGAFAAFQAALSRSPKELRLYTPAAEAMLAKKEGVKALEFAEQGLTQARSQNNRDAEQHLLELIGAAKKQIG